MCLRAVPAEIRQIGVQIPERLAKAWFRIFDRFAVHRLLRPRSSAYHLTFKELWMRKLNARVEITGLRLRFFDLLFNGVPIGAGRRLV